MSSFKNKDNNKKLNFIAYVFIFLLISFMFSEFAGFYFGICFLAVGLITAVLKNSNISRIKVFDIIPMVLLFVWFYGMILGFAHGNKTDYIIRNFSGMTLYSMYFILVLLNVNVDGLIKSVLVSGYFVSLIMIVAYLSNFIYIPNIFIQFSYLMLADPSHGSSTGQYRVFSTSAVVIFPLLGYALFMIYHSKNLVKGFIIFFVSSFCLVIITASKGFLFGLISLIVIYILLDFIFKLGQKKIKKNNLFFMPLIFLAAYLLIYYEYATIFVYMFSADDVSNQIRYTQFFEIIKELSFWGKGLGSTYDGYQRHDAQYGVEISYLNILHKFGWISIFVFFSFFFTFYKAIICFRYNAGRALFVIFSLGYLFPALGNPIIFSTISVTLHCVALYVCREFKSPTSNR